jgi:hypothetical protein
MEANMTQVKRESATVGVLGDHTANGKPQWDAGFGWIDPILRQRARW